MSFPSGYDLNDAKVQKPEAILLRTLSMNVCCCFFKNKAERKMWEIKEEKIAAS